MRAATYFFICVDLALAFFEEPAWLPLPFLVSLQHRMANQTLSYMSWTPSLFLLFTSDINRHEFGFIFLAGERGWRNSELVLSL